MSHHLIILLYIALGGAIGAALRHVTNMSATAMWGTGFPVGTTVVNVLGSFVMGALVTLFALKWSAGPEMRAFLTVGLLGAYTTFSAFSLDSVSLFERGAYLEVAAYIAVSVCFSIAGLVLGMFLMRQILT